MLTIAPDARRAHIHETAPAGKHIRRRKIRTSPHHLRLVRGIFQVQFKVPDHLTEIVGKLNGKVGAQAWLIRSTGTGNRAEADRIRDNIIMPEFRATIDQAEHEHDPVRRCHQIVDGLEAYVAGAPDRFARRAAMRAEIHSMYRRTLQVESNCNHVALGLDKIVEPTREPVPFAKLVDQWADEESKQSKTRAHRHRVMQGLADFLGHDDIRRVSADDLNRYLTESLVAAKKAGKIKAPTIRDHVIHLKAMFKYASDKIQDQPNPAEKLRFVGGQTEERDMHDAIDLETRARIVREAVLSTDPVVKWGTLLAAYGAGRNGEVYEADTRDIECIDGTWGFHIREKFRPETQAIKNKPSKRFMPIHPAIIRAGFLECVEMVRRDYHGGGHGPLFPMVNLDKHGRRNTLANNRVNKWMKAIDAGETFHAWRATVRTMLENAGVSSDRARRIVGHAAQDDDAARYLKHEWPKLIDAIGKLDDPLVGVV